MLRHIPSPLFERTSVSVQSGYNEMTHSMMVINRVRFYRRRHGLIASWCYLAVTVLTECGWWLLRGARQSRAAVIALLSPAGVV